jgi:hypothetical protein
LHRGFFARPASRGEETRQPFAAFFAGWKWAVIRTLSSFRGVNAKFEETAYEWSAGASPVVRHGSAEKNQMHAHPSPCAAEIGTTDGVLLGDVLG